VPRTEREIEARDPVKAGATVPEQEAQEKALAPSESKLDGDRASRGSLINDEARHVAVRGVPLPPFLVRALLLINPVRVLKLEVA
jgi:hypothetical protein